MEEELKNEEEEEKKKRVFTPSQETMDARQALTLHQSTRPEGYTSLWEAQLQSAMDRILNREDFSYNLNGDALYRQYRDAAVRDGRSAMMDAMGNAAALTGGYGNSYAATVGQQAYNAQLDRLNDRIPELYSLALDRYRSRGQRLMDEYDLLAGADSRDYERYLDSLSDWDAQFDRLNSLYTDRRDFDYGAYEFDVQNDQWQAEFDEDLRRFELEWEAKHPTYSGGYYGGSKKKNTKAKKDNYDSILATAVGMAKNGDSWNSINGYIKNAASSGAITQKQSATISGKALDAKPKSR